MKLLVPLLLLPALTLNAQERKVKMEVFASLKQATVYNSNAEQNIDNSYSFSFKPQPLLQVYTSCAISRKDRFYWGMGVTPSTYHLQWQYANWGAYFKQDLKMDMTTVKYYFGGSHLFNNQFEWQLGTAANNHILNTHSISTVSGSNDSFELHDEFGDDYFTGTFSISIQSALKYGITKRLSARLDFDYDFGNKSNNAPIFGWQHDVNNEAAQSSKYTRFIGSHPRFWYVGIGVGIVLARSRY